MASSTVEIKYKKVRDEGIPVKILKKFPLRSLSRLNDWFNDWFKRYSIPLDYTNTKLDNCCQGCIRRQIVLIIINASPLYFHYHNY